MFSSKGITFFILAACYFSCNKFNSVKHLVLDETFRSYFSYKNGSEWTYLKESDTNISEKVIVENYLEGKFRRDGLDQDFFEYKLKSNRDSLILARSVADDGNTGRSVFLVQDTAFKFAVQWFYVAGQFSGLSGTNDTTIMHNTYTVHGIVYTSVLEIKPADSKYFKSIIIAKNIGIIQKQLINGDIYILKSYSVL